MWVLGEQWEGYYEGERADEKGELLVTRMFTFLIDSSVKQPRCPV